MLRIVTFALVSLTAHAGRATSAAARAQQWMQDHKVDPNDQAGMNDLKASDPNAFAIVQALLAKQQLGLLDPKHPTANFAGAHKHEDSDEQSAVDILKAAPAVEAPGVPVSAVAVHQTYSPGSMWNFKAKRAQDDDSMVASIMGDVTGVAAVDPAIPQAAPAPTSSLITSSRSQAQSSAMDGDMATFGFGGQTSMANAEARMEEQRPAPAAHVSHPLSSFGMPTLDWGSRYAGTSVADQSQTAPVVAPVSASMSQQTSSLRSVVQPAPVEQTVPAPVQDHQNPYLNGIDFSGDLPSKPQASMAQQKLRTRKPSAAELAENPYLDGLNFPGVAEEQPKPEAPKPEASMSQKASYLDQIGFPGHRRQRVQEEAPRPKTGNSLTDFSWHGDDQVAAPAPIAPHPETEMMQKVEEGVTQAKLSGNLMDWLHPSDDPLKKAVDPTHVITAELQQPSEDAVDPTAMDKYNNWVQGGN